MVENAILYGEVLPGTARRQIEQDYPDIYHQIIWQDIPRVFETRDGFSWVFIDLDDPRFARPDFLLSLATAGEKVKLIGKVAAVAEKDPISLARMGISEILDANQCLKKLHEFLETLQGTSSSEPKPRTSSKYDTNALIGRSPVVNDVRKTLALLAEVDFPSALILGETGTGKGLIAKILHHSGRRHDHNLVEVNCSAIPDALFESELFGHTKGAFTGATGDKKGLFEYAERGTLFLDEVGNLSSSAQAKLLKIIEDKRLRRVGEIEGRIINVRVVAATNLHLQEAVAGGGFREDLFYRLNLLTIILPPLRERLEDIDEIAEYYLGFYSTNYGKPKLQLSNDAREILHQHNWPGNVRELCNIIERAVLLAKKETIDAEDIASALTRGRISVADREKITIEIPPQGISLDEIEQRVVKQVLDFCDWNKSRAAEFLQISRPRLRRLLKMGGVDRNRRSKKKAD